MSLKKNIGVLVLLLVLLSMSAVSAEDVSVDTNNTYQAPNEIQKDFTSLQTDIDNSQNVFELNYDVKHGDDEKDNYGISITKNTIINGNGHTIDANGHGSIFVVKDSSVTLTLNDLTLINANPVSDSSGIVSNGGAVYFDGSTLIVNNVNFKNNTVYKYGGAIYTTGTCIVDSSVFDGNDVQFRSQNIGNGGAAIYADNGASLLISNSQIINNHKNMVIRDNNVGDLVVGVVVATGYTKISKSYFRNNSGCYGGAVTSLGYTSAGKNQIIIENSVFDANRAFQGAAVNVLGSTFKISGTNFTNNKGVGYGSGNPNVGALLTWYGCEGTISDCNFINNTAENGAAYRLGDDHNGVSSASVDSCTFINNTATNQGGAIYEGGKTGKATLDIKNSTFTNNSAKKEGSAIYNGYTLNIDDDTTFTNNMVYMYYTGTLNIGEIKTFTDLQNAINMVEGDIRLNSNVTMLASEADKFVNGIVVDHLVNLKCDGFTINANNLGRIFNVTSTADKLNIYNANLINGNADIGGAIYNTGSVYAFNTAFKDNTAATMGGAVFNKGTLTIQKCIVDSNDITKRTSSASEDYGGAAIYNWYDSTLFIKNSTISNNLKNYKNGDYVVGAVTSLGKTIISQNSYFVNNSGRWGGAITTSGSSLPGKKVNELSISDSTFSKNGGLYGAGIFIQGSKFSITSCVFDSNTASGKGNMTPNDNNGAAIEVTNTDKAITGTISKTKFTNNKAQYGGAIDICAGTIKIINSKFINNSADVEGGAIDINTLNGNPKVTISSSKFINNSAPLGGAILNIKDLTVKGSTFINNTPNTIFNWAGAGGNLNLNIRTFTDLQNAIGLVTGTLTFNQNIAMTAKEAANFTNGITINKDIAIDGKGHTIDARELGRIFNIGEGFTVTLTNATLINGKADKGGAIYNDGSLTLSDVKLSDNAADSYGGAVFNNGHLVVSDSVFDSNDIVNRGSASVDYGGAAIYNWYDGVLTVSGSNFTNNIKNYKNGDRLVGAIATIGDATISDSYFVNNAGRWGGAISTAGYLLAGDDVNTLTVSGSTFKENGGLYGAGIFVAGSDFTVSDCVFDKNTAFGKGDMTPNNNNGAAIVVTDTGKDITGIITDSNFTNNKAHFSGAVDICEGKITIKNSIFVNNSAEYCAGAIAVDSQINKPAVEIINSKFDSNSAEYGGAIYNYYNLTVADSTFTNNSKDTIYNFRVANLDLGIKTFTDLQNAIGLVRGTLTLDSDIAMTDDEAANFKDGVVINKNIVIDGKGHTIDARDLGRIFNIGEGFTVTLTNATLINGKADKGGAIYNDGSLTLSDVKLSDNAADSYGGAVFNNGHLVVSDSVFDSNDIVNRGSASVDYGGAAIYNWYDGVLTVSGSNFTNNIKNYKNGDRLVGAIATIGDATISDSYFVNNAGRWGGAISTAGYLLAGDDVNTLTVSGSTFKENGGLYGAGIFVAGSDFTVSDCVFDKNTAFGKGDMTPNNNNGAAIVVTDTGKDITGAITGSKFTNNKAQYGGAIYICEGNIAISDSLFENNSADVEGGAIDIGSAINNPVVTIEDSKFVNNTPQAIHNSKELHLGIETFTDLQNAINLVDGILTLDSDIAMTDDEAAGFVDGVAINKNIRIDGKGHTISAEDLGRIFSIGEGFTVTLTNATLINGKADKGGAIYNDGSLTLSDVKLSDNAADSYGGAVFNNGHLVVSDSVFDSNDIVNRGSASVDYGGAAIYNWYDGVLTVSGSNFTNNIKNYKNGDRLVGAIATIGDATISDSYFVNNAGRWGGAISTAGYLLAGDDVNTLTVSGSTFKENGGLYGAGIFVWGSDFIVSDCVFDKNTASGKGDMTPNNNNGAAIEVTDTNKAIAGTITGSKFVNNKAQYGGAVDICEGNIKITDSEFVNNSADVEGGAIDINTLNGNPEVSILGSKFINNSAPRGGAIVNVKDLTVRNTEFVNNTSDAIFNYVGFGGNLDLGIENFTDLQNAIGLVTGTLTLNQNVVMTDDEAANFVNGVIINKNIRIDGKGHTIDARDLGRIFSIGEGFTVTLTNATLINGKADKGGAIYNDGSLTLSDVKLSDNAADSYGGAVLNNGELIVTNSVFDANDILNRGSAGVDHGGAAIYNWENAKLDISKSNFTNNIKNYVNGDRLVGAVTTIGNATIRDSYFVNNSGRWGGALAATGGVSGSAINTISVDGTKFVNNTALYGGAMFVWASNYTISNSVFDNNSAFGKGDMSPNDNNGGALIVTQDNIPVSGKIVNSNFTNNKAQYGGAAWINEGTVDIDGSNFINNTATTTAGAIGFDSQYTKIIATVDSSKFVNNTAGSYAGAIYNLGDLTVSGSEFDNNKAQFGDIIYNNKIYNKEGILSINGNKYSNYTENKAPIINIGDINTISSTGGIIVTVLDNKTVNVCYGDVVTLHATVVADGVLVAGQKLFFVIDNVEYIANSLGNGSYIASYEVKDVGSKTVGIVYDGSDVNIKTGMLNISKATPDLTVGALNITVGDLEIITVTGPKDATGLITLTLNGIDYILPIYNGEAKFYFQDLTADEYEVSASYSGDNHYVAAENSTVFKVDKVLANLKINVEDITFGENGLVIITLPSDIDGSVVTVNVNGKVYPVTVENGFAKLPLRELNAGDYTISAVFAGNDKYLPGVSNALLTVSKADPALNVFISDVDYGGIFNINVALTGVDAIGLNGNVIVTVNNKDYTVAVTDGKGNATGVKLAAGTYDFTAKFAGSDNYNDVSDSGNFKVNKVDSAIYVAVNDIKVGEDAVITVKLFGDATGSVTVNVNGKDYTEPVVNGVVNVKVSGLKADTYDVAVKYSGDNNYNTAVATSSFTVSKVDSIMDVTVDDIVFGGDLIVDAVLPDDATGEVVITVNGVDYHVAIENGKATGTIGGLAAGDYTVTVKYAGDDKYTGVEVAENVNVAKAQPVLGVVIADVDYGNGFVIEATLTGVNGAPLSGNVIVTVAGKEYTVKVTDGKGIATGDKLAAGTYAFAAVWAGDDNYNIVTENGDFKVNKIDSAIDVSADTIDFGEDAVISIKLASDATGEVVITVNGEDYTAAIENGVASVTVSGLKADDYTVEVKYAGDNNYNEAAGSAEFSVLKITPDMDVTVEDIVFGEDLIVNAVLPGDATGEVVITVNGVDYHVAIENGEASVTVSGLEAGDYTIAVKYAGDDNYNAVDVTKGVNIAKADPALNVIIDSVDYGNVFTVNAVLTGVNNAPLDTNIIVTVNGKNYIVAIVNGKGTFHADKLAAGSYNFNARFAGSNNYNEVSDSGKFNVYKVDSAIDVAVSDINVGEDAVISVKLADDATGEVVITVNGEDYTAAIENGVASVTVSDLKAGDYTVAVKYAGDNNYNAVVATSSFTVSKVDSTMDVTVDDIVFGEDLTVNAVLPADATGEVVITVDGTPYTATIIDGKATGTIKDLTAGDYTVSVKYAGDDKYAGVEFTGVVNVAKADAVLGVVIADVDYGNGFVIEATLTGVNGAPLTGDVIVTVNGKEYTVEVAADGKGIATGDKLAARTYGFAAVWAGNDNYNIVTENGDFKVNKVDSSIDVAVDTIDFGEDAVISVKLADDATGEVVITVNGEDYTAAIENGVASVTVSDLEAGDFTVAVKYAGDNNYNGATGSAEFSVLKITPDMDVTVDSAVFGEDLTVVAVLPADATGEVVITVNGKDYSVVIENGVASATVPGINAGYYTIVVKYAGDNNYNAVDVTKGVNVAKADAALNVIINNVDYGNVFTVNSVLTGVNNAPLTGDVIVTVNGKDYTVNVVNGKGNVTGVKLAAGSYDFTAKFAGDNNYNAVSDSGKFNVNKVDSAIYVAVSDIKVGEDAVITVKLLSDATGNVTVNVNDKNYNGTVINGMANVEVSGLKADTYDVAVKYSGDNNYNDAVATSSFTVSKVDPTMDVTVDGIVFGEDLTVEAVLPADATGKVVIVVDGTSYTANITDGKATQVVKDLTAGYHTVGVKYGGDDKYNDVVVDGFVIVDKAQPVLGVVIADVNYGNEFAIEATLTGVNSTPLNGNVIVTVNGKFYVVNVTDGKGTLTGVKLAAGTYGFTAVWAGNDNYAAVDENGDFKVNKLNSTVAVNADDIKVGENVTVSVNVPSDATGNVIVTVDGKDYTVAIVDGKAVKTIADLKANNYTVTVKYAGDNNYNPNQNTTKFTVSKISDYNMNITVPGDVKVGEDAVIIVNVPKDASGNVTVSVGKDVYNAVISNGSAKVVVSGLGAGVYNVSATFADDKYAQNKANATVVVSKVTDYNMNVSVPEFKEGVNSTISVDLPKDATGTVTVEIDGKKYTANVTNGTAKVNIPALSAGNHNITTTYSGDAKYDSMTKKGNITVIPNVNLDVNDVVMFYHDGTRLVAKLTDSQGKPIVNATIYFNINGVDYAKSTDDNGTASMGLNLDSNVYAVTVTYNGSDIYSKISKNVTVTINPSIIAKDLVKMYQNDTKFYAKFIGSDGKALVNTTVRFNIHGVFYNRTTNDDGIAELGIMLRPGNYILTAYNPVTGEEQGFNITVKSLIVQNDLTKYYLNASKFEATIYDKNGSLAVNKTVTFNIHGVFYTRSTDDKGVVSLGISLRPGEYIITTIYEGLAVGNNITVLPTLVTSDLNMTHEDGSNFTAQTLDGQGKPLANQNVTFNINGVFYNKVTDENGVASLAMRLMSGKYIITSYWNDFQTGNTIIIS